MSHTRLLIAVASIAAIACSDSPTSPRNPLATRLNELADSSADDDYRISSALYAASAVLNAGGRISTVQLVIDSQPYTFSAVAMRMAYSVAACTQLKEMLVKLSSGDTSIYDYTEDMCRPMHQMVAWEGDDMRRIAIVAGDTGSISMSLSSFAPSMTFFGQMSDRVNDKEWWSLSGSQTSRLEADRGRCRQFSIPEEGIEFSCRLVILQHGFDMVLEEFDYVDYDDYEDDYDSLRTPGPPLDIRDSSVRDTIGVDTSWVYEPGPTHTMSMRPAALEGVALTVMRFVFPEGGGMTTGKPGIRVARPQRMRAMPTR